MSGVTGVFTGSSTYSNDFLQVIDRAVQIASLPINQLQNQKNSLSGESAALSSLSTAFGSLNTALSSVDTAADTGRYSVSYSDPSVLAASASSGATAGTYSLQVVDVGSQARANSTATVANPAASSISSASSFTLNINGKQISNINPAANTLNSLAAAINAAAPSDVQATVVNIGSTASPAYELSIQNRKYGTSTITLTGDAGNLLDEPSAATPVQYRINGQPAVTPLSSDNRSVTIAPNVMVTVLKNGTTDLTVGPSTASLAQALGTFVDAYNSVTKALDTQRGSSTTPGALSGQSIIGTLTQAMRKMTSYTTTTSVRGMSDLGLTFDKFGVLSFDASKLSDTAAKDYQGVSDFLGSIASGNGFLGAANAILKSVTDSGTGAIQAATDSVAAEQIHVDALISDNQDRVDQYKLSLNAQMAAADALIASLQQQASYFTSMFAAEQTNQRSISG